MMNVKSKYIQASIKMELKQRRVLNALISMLKEQNENAKMTIEMNNRVIDELEDEMFKG